jgi:hypothetical protein
MGRLVGIVSVRALAAETPRASDIKDWLVSIGIHSWAAAFGIPKPPRPRMKRMRTAWMPLIA